MTALKTTMKQTLGMTDDRNDDHQHLLPHEDGWALKRTGADRPSFTFESKEDAMVKAIEVARNQGTVLVIHGRDGRVQEQRDYA